MLAEYANKDNGGETCSKVVFESAFIVTQMRKNVKVATVF